jgi:hypothetical protein
MSSDYDIAAAAAALHRSKDWLQRNWRGLPGFPPPFVGGEKGGRPWWRAADVEAWKGGKRWDDQGRAASSSEALGQLESPTNVVTLRPDNDPIPAPRGSVASRLIAAAGG